MALTQAAPILKIIKIPQAISDRTALARRQHARIGLVPTMGALHEGHLKLVERARNACDLVICSIFVNPLQFNDPLDLARYPRRIEEDADMLEKAGCDVLFHPERSHIFSDFQPITYDLGGLDEAWEGASRPGHFQGVVNVVERLFFYVRPDEAFFGEKDRQQLTILQHMARSLHWPEKIIACPTVREADGLAMSSRNLRLDRTQRRTATVLFKALELARSMAYAHPVDHIHSKVKEFIGNAEGVELDHFGLAEPNGLAPITDWAEHSTAIALIAAQVGPVRLIDNITITRPSAAFIDHT